MGIINLTQKEVDELQRLIDQDILDAVDWYNKTHDVCFKDAKIQNEDEGRLLRMTEEERRQQRAMLARLHESNSASNFPDIQSMPTTQEGPIMAPFDELVLVGEEPRYLNEVQGEFVEEPVPVPVPAQPRRRPDNYIAPGTYVGAAQPRTECISANAPLDIIVRNFDKLIQSKNISLESLSDTEKEVLELSRSLEGGWLAGGAPLALYRGRLDELKDWDLFFEFKEASDIAKKQFSDIGFTSVKDSKWSASYEKNKVLVQFVKIKYFKKIENVFSSFDFSVCCFAVEEDCFCFTEQAKLDVTDNVLRLVSLVHPTLCLKRVARYGSKGFKVSSEFASQFIRQIRSMSTMELTTDKILGKGEGS